MNRGTLYLIPVAFDNEHVDVIPEYVRNIVSGLDEFIVENARSARRFLRKIGYKGDFDQGVMHVLDKRTKASELSSFLKNVSDTHPIGLMSEAGCPGIADPGANIVSLAHRKGIRVQPLVGPSSILLALIGSGMNGQKFTFHGYLPIEKSAREVAIKKLENKSISTSDTQIFMETPYRNNQLIGSILKCCDGETYLCIACDLTLPTELIQTKKIKDWKTKVPDVHKRPCIFLIGK